MAEKSNENRRNQAIEKSIQLIATAIDLLDAHQGPPEAAVHLELAHEKLRSAIQRSK